MIDQILETLTDAGFLLNLASAVVATLVAFGVTKAIMDMWSKRARKLGRDALFVKAFRLPLYTSIGLVGALEVFVGIFEHVHPAWVVPTRSIQGFVFLFLIFVMLYRLVSVVEQKVLERNKKEREKEGGAGLDSGVIHGVAHTLKGLVLVVAGLTVMSNLGIKIEGILAFGGIGTILIGFMARETLSNYFSGMVIFMDRPFSVGDWIRIDAAGVEGTVEEIGWRITRVRTFDLRPLYVPNSVISSNVIENPQRMTNRRIYEYMGLRYDDIGVLEAVVNDVRDLLRNNPEIDQDKTLMVNFDRYGDFSLDFFIYAMTKTKNWGRFHEVKQAILLDIARIVQKRGAEFAFPTRTVHYQPGAVPEIGGKRPPDSGGA